MRRIDDLYTRHPSSAWKRWKRRAQGTPDIHNTEQSTQFTSEAFTSALTGAGVSISMDGKGSYQDNIFTERLWRTSAMLRVTHIPTGVATTTISGNIKDEKE